MSEGCRTLKEKENNKYKKYNGCRTQRLKKLTALQAGN